MQEGLYGCEVQVYAVWLALHTGICDRGGCLGGLHLLGVVMALTFTLCHYEVLACLALPSLPVATPTLMEGSNLWFVPLNMSDQRFHLLFSSL